MFILTANGAARKFSQLIERLEAMQPRLEVLQSINEEADALGLLDQEARQFVRQLTLGRLQMNVELQKAQLGIFMGAHKWRETLPLLRACNREIRSVEAALDQVEGGVASARTRLQREFGQGK